MSEFKFTAEVKANWLTDLRSGEFEQCQGTLHDCGKYCCLGVLAQRNDMAVSGRECDATYKIIEDTIGFDMMRELWRMNDAVGRKNPFTTIADYIEANVPAQD